MDLPRILAQAALVWVLALTACANPALAPTSMPSAQETATMRAAATEQDYAAKRAAMNFQPVKQWPLRFKRHSFSVHTYDTYGAKVRYDGPQINQDPDKLQPSSASYGPDYNRNWSGIHGGIRNFPPPAKVSWRSRDGQVHEAEVDIGEIFKDELIRHHVSREDMAELPDGEYQNEPGIILEINDRTIRVWMRAFIPTKQLQVPGDPNSDARDELVLVKTSTY